MIFGRSREQAYLAELMQAARQGASAAVVVSGDAGIGKSTLLQESGRVAQEAYGFTILRTRGIEAECAIPFSGLSELIDPAFGQVEDLPPRQAAAIRGALALGPAVPGDRFAVAAAVLSLLGATARDGPVLALVDDAQWLDASSAEALAFVARRIKAEGVLFLFAVRAEEPGTRRFDQLDRLSLNELDEVSAATLLAQRLGSGASPAVVSRLLAEARGNPLALVELPAGLSDDQVTGKAPIVGPIPLDDMMTRAFLRRVRGLRGRVRACLLVAAASDVEFADVLEAALQLDGSSLVDLEPAEDAGLVTLREGRLVFRHPLIRSAVYHAASPSQRRQAHRRLATALETIAAPEAAVRRAWHLASAAVTSDETVAAALVDVGRSAVARHGHAIATRAFQRAAQLTPDPERRAERLLLAASAAVPAGAAADAITLLAEGRRWTQQPSTDAVLECEQLRLLAWEGSSDQGRAQLFAFAERLEASAPQVAARAYLAAAQASLSSYDTAAISRGVQGASRLADDDRTKLTAEVLAAFAAAQSGDPPTARRLLDECRSGLADVDPLTVDQLVAMAGVAMLAVENFDDARALLQRAADASGEAGAAGLLAVQLPWLAVLDFAIGDWTSALARAHEAVPLAMDTGWSAQLPNSLTVLARIEAGAGLESCRKHAADALRLVDVAKSIGTTVHAHAAVGLLDLGLDRADDALASFEPAMDAAASTSAPLLRLHVLPDLVEAQIRAGQVSGAVANLTRLDELARTTERASAMACVARLEGLLARDDPRPWFDRALQWHARSASPFERARTQLAYGARLRRLKDRATARTHLTAALTTFQALGATPWADRARAELALGGRAVPTTGATVATSLTPQELQVCLAVARGLTNASAAASLFLSVKTVEYHLGNAYRKLGIRSRSQLIRRLAASPPVAAMT